MSLDAFRATLAATRERVHTHTRPIPLDALDDWRTDPETGALRHRSGRFFSIEGLRVRLGDRDWQQPIIVQPEVGILGLLAKRTGGVRRFLVQLKPEPGNRNGVQISPTVQATRSNYTGVHLGSAVPYLSYFRDAARHRVLLDVRQSEHASCFLGKRNRNMVVETTDDIAVRPGFCWLTRAELDALLGEDDLVNMDTRSVLACLPDENPVTDRPAHPLPELLRWITDVRSLTEVTVERRPLHGLAGWRRDRDRISHHEGRLFDVIGVQVEAAGREVARWSQPMLAPRGPGLVALLVTRVEGTPHALVRPAAEPGCADVAELAPTVQHAIGDPIEPSPLLDEVLGAAPDTVLFDAMLSDEGGRFHHSSNRHLIVETPDARPEPPGFRWLSLGQLTELLRHSFYVNMHTRSLLACLRAVEAGRGGLAGVGAATGAGAATATTAGAVSGAATAARTGAVSGGAAV
ncbi:dTDP-4-dehydro-6-deoxy-alpha-D-glucopyranose 2,3-dehydratase [Streptomyces sp. enrichment culture]|uniref:NDP-hexose 2,3-dehydratase family protein n=1 Tax=Streptomyces sp. enrichment culture TaxID=1795815 RepID=UPI003F56EAEC